MKTASWSLRQRLLLATLAGLTLALALAGVVLSNLFKEHVLQQFQASLTQQLDQVTAGLEFDAQDRPQLATTLSDPRWQRPYSGLYWQVDELSDNARTRRGVLRSRSLWDTWLALEADPLVDGGVHVHEAQGPAGSHLLVIERTVRAAQADHARWRLIVAADLQPTEQATAHFNRVLALSLLVLLVLLLLAAWAQVGMGLKPLRTLQRSLQDVRQARSHRLQGEFPPEVQPLVDDFNSVLDRHDDLVARARTHAGNLAHALKTPLTVLDQAASAASAASASQTTGEPGLAQAVQEQVRSAQRQIDWHLARARMAASQGLPGQRVDLAPTLAGLVRVMQRVHAERALQLTTELPAEPLFFAGEEQDLQEMLGNLLDNASTTTARAFRPRTSRPSSSASTPPGRRGRPSGAIPASACPSPARSSRPRAGPLRRRTSVTRRGTGPARGSSSDCPSVPAHEARPCTRPPRRPPGPALGRPLARRPGPGPLRVRQERPRPAGPRRRVPAGGR